MSLISKIEDIISVLNEVNDLKVALGFDSSTSITDIIAKIKATATELESLVIPSATATVATTTSDAAVATAAVTGV